MTYVIIAACLAVGLFVWRVARKVRAKLRKANAMAEYYESLARVWRAISLNDGTCGHPSVLNGISSSRPCIEEGFTYISSVPKEDRVFISNVVCGELDEAYYHYLDKMCLVVKRFLEMKANDYRDEKLEYYLHQNERWLVIEGNSPYFDPAIRKFLCQLKLGGKHGKEMKKFLIEQAKACGERLIPKRKADKAKLALANRPSKPYTGRESVFFGNPIGNCGFAEPLTLGEIWRKIWR